MKSTARLALTVLPARSHRCNTHFAPATTAKIGWWLGPSGLSRVVTFLRAFLPAVSLEHAAVEVQSLAVRAETIPSPLHHPPVPLRHYLAHMLEVKLAEKPKKARCAWNPRQGEHRLYRCVPSQQLYVRNTVGSHVDGDNERYYQLPRL